MTLTRQKLAAAVADDLVIARTVRKPHRCVAADPTKGAGPSVRPNPNYRPDCLQNINPGDVYGEYVGEAAFAESGRPYLPAVRCSGLVKIRMGTATELAGCHNLVDHKRALMLALLLMGQPV
jgi:hypothetical protein